jgi:primosomal replication protein N
VNPINKLQLTALLCACVVNTYADEAIQTFNIPAQSLHSSLQALANQAGVAVFFLDDQVAGKKAPELKGNTI